MTADNSNVVCPLMAHNPDLYDRDCLRAKCAWWDIEGGECCIHTIAKQGMYAATELNATVNRLVSVVEKTAWYNYKPAADYNYRRG